MNIENFVGHWTNEKPFVLEHLFVVSNRSERALTQKGPADLTFFHENYVLCGTNFNLLPSSCYSVSSLFMNRLISAFFHSKVFILLAWIIFFLFFFSSLSSITYSLSSRMSNNAIWKFIHLSVFDLRQADFSSYNFFGMGPSHWVAQPQVSLILKFK